MPAGVGIMLHIGRLQDAWLAIGIALVVSTALAVAATAIAMLGLERLLGRRPEGGGSLPRSATSGSTCPPTRCCT